MSTHTSSSARRSFLTRLKTGAASLAALTVGGNAMAQVKSASAGRVEPLRHSQDDWMDELPSKHRMVFDTTSADGFGEGLRFARNFVFSNRAGYGLESKDLGLIVVARHQSTSLAFNDAMWAKYGMHFAGDLPPSMVNATFKANPNSDMLSGLAKDGVHFAVCGMATNRLAGIIARATNAKAEEIFAELTSHLISNAHMAAAGILAVNRAQERGYTFSRA